MRIKTMLRAACLAAAVAAHAGSPAQPAAPAASAAATPLASGEVRKVDKDAGKLTLRHGPIQNLDMPAMTMVFRVAQPAMLDKLKEGDKLRFAVERVNGAFTVTHIELEK